MFPIIPVLWSYENKISISFTFEVDELLGMQTRYKSSVWHARLQQKTEQRNQF